MEQGTKNRMFPKLEARVNDSYKLAMRNGIIDDGCLKSIFAVFRRNTLSNFGKSTGLSD